MNVLVTGVTGYLGGWVVRELQARGFRVSTTPHGGRRHWKLRYDRAFSVTHPAQLKEQCEWADALVHLAWYAVPGNDRFVYTWSSEQADQLFRYFSSRNRPYATKPVVFASTLSVYGDRQGQEVKEECRPSPNCDYTRWKAAAEDALWWQVGKAKGSILRFGSLMGVGAPKGRTRTDLCVNSFAVAGWKDEPIQVWDPDCYKPVIHVRDAARLVVEAVRGKLPGTTNCAAGCLQAWELAEVVHDLTGAKVEIVGKGREGTRSCVAKCEKLRAALPHIQFLKVDDAVAEFKGWSPKPGDHTEAWS